MVHAVFTRLSYEEQLVSIFEDGLFLAHRWAAPDRVSLYHLGSFFVELYYDTRTDQIACLRNFRNTLPLEAYVTWMELPKLLKKGLGE
jgi:hypothetical protein